MRRDREVMHGDLPSLHAPLRVVGRGWGWGVYQFAPPAARLRRHPPPPTSKSELRSSRPRRFAGGGEESFAMADCLETRLFENVIPSHFPAAQKRQPLEQMHVLFVLQE